MRSETRGSAASAGAETITTVEGPQPCVEREVKARGVRVSVLEYGIGPTNVILLHGWGSNPWVYKSFMQSLPHEEFRVIAMDFWGRSERPWQGYNVSGFADQVRDVMDACGMPTSFLGGHSLGGITSQLVALRYPDRVDGLLLVGTGPTTENHGTLYELLTKLRECGGSRDVLRELLASGYGTLPPAETFESYVNHMMLAPYEGLVEAMASGTTYNFVPVLNWIEMPCLVVHGKLDSGRNDFHVSHFRSGLKKCEVVALNCGHYPMEEASGEFSVAARAFLERHRRNDQRPVNRSGTDGAGSASSSGLSRHAATLADENA